MPWVRLVLSECPLMLIRGSVVLRPRASRGRHQLHTEKHASPGGAVGAIPIRTPLSAWDRRPGQGRVSAILIQTSLLAQGGT